MLSQINISFSAENRELVRLTLFLFTTVDSDLALSNGAVKHRNMKLRVFLGLLFRRLVVQATVGPL